jgi:hypothetical protein
MNSFQLFEKYRFWLYIILITLFILDFITTIIGINLGLVETNERLSLVLNTPVLHLAIKMLFCFALICYQEYIFRRDRKVRTFENNLYSFFIIVMSAVIFIFILIVLHNYNLIISN